MRQEPLKVRVAFDKNVPRGVFALRAFDGKREVGIITGRVRDDDAMVTGFMSTRYAVVSGRREPVLLSDKGERERVAHEDYTGRGVGRALLDALAKEACKRGLMLASGTDRSAMMERFWEKQEAAGRATREPIEPLYKGDQDYEFVVRLPCKHPGFLGLKRKPACPAFTHAQAARAARKVRGARVFPVSDLRVGMNVEREHSNVGACHSPTVAAKIAVAHLRERTDYYRRLKRFVER